MIIIVPYQRTWPAEFGRLGSDLRAALGPLALRIDHIGSTAVPGLAAKDIIDMQLTVAGLQPVVEQALNSAGYQRNTRNVGDHIPPGWSPDPQEWAKWVFLPASGGRPVHLHVRVAGRANQRYPLLFRDYLRQHPAAAAGYAQVKVALARLHPEDKEAYYDVKDPVCDIIMAGAVAWAAATRWELGPTDC